VWAGLVSIPYVFVAGQTLPAAQLNADFATLYNLVNGNISNANINAAAAISSTKINFVAASFPLTALNHQAAGTIVANITGGSASPTAVTYAQVNAVLPVFTSTLNGLAPLSGGGTTNYLRADGSWAAPPGTAGSGTVTASPQLQLPFYSGAGTANVITGNPSITTGGGGTGTLNLGIVGAGATSGAIYLSNGGAYETNIQCGPSQLQNVDFYLPITDGLTNAILFNTDGSGATEWSVVSGDITFVGSTGVATLATVNTDVGTYSNANVTVNAKGLITAASSGSAGGATVGFGGTGLDGVTTTWTTPQLNASTLTVTGATGPTNYGRFVVNTTSTAAFNNGAVVSALGLGYGGSTGFLLQGAGPYPGQTGLTALIGGGGGGSSCSQGGAGGGASVANGGGGGGHASPLFPTVIGEMGSGGGGTTALSAPPGGGAIKVCSIGAISTAAGSLITVDGTVGNAAITNAHGGTGGGCAGSISLWSQTSIALAAGSCSAAGGIGGAGLTTGDGGGAGGGGTIFGMSPSNTNSLVTLTAVSGGAGGASPSGTPGSAGTVGQVIMVTGTPSAPLISMLEHGGFDKLQRFCHNNEICELNITEEQLLQITTPLTQAPRTNIKEIADRLRRVA
jgi:hypothetical protein